MLGGVPEPGWRGGPATSTPHLTPSPHPDPAPLPPAPPGSPYGPPSPSWNAPGSPASSCSPAPKETAVSPAALGRSTSSQSGCQ